MSEIEKLYELAGVNKKCIDKRYEKCTGVCYDCKYFIYPPFTAEKQLDLICFIVKSKERISFTNKPYILTRDVLANGLAFAINDLWQDLSEEEKEEIKRILE